MMLAHAEHVETDLVGEFGLFQEVAHPLLRADHVPVQRVLLQFREGVDPDLHGVRNTVPGPRCSGGGAMGANHRPSETPTLVNQMAESAP